MSGDIERDEIVWEDPPSVLVYGPRGKWHRFRDILAEYPGKWAVVPASRMTTVGNEKRALKSQGCEVVQHRHEDGTTTLYARWPEDVA